MSEKKTGFIARLLGKKEEQPTGELSTEEKLKAAEERIAGFDADEAAIEGKFAELEGKVTGAEKDRDEKVKAAETDRDAKVKAAEKERDEKVKAAEDDRDAKVKAAEESVAKKVSAGVKDQLAALGVDVEKLPGKAPEPGKETEGLKGKARAAAAFEEQMAGR